VGDALQRLFSTFPDGWPGLGLLVLRVGDAVPLIYFGIAGLTGTLEPSVNLLLPLVSATGGLLLLIGLWTPIAGVAVAADEVWGALSITFAPHDDHRMIYVLLAILSVGVAMLGPGAWSVDARLFGRRRLEFDGRQPRR
jgi:putative oxidoreductase